MIRLFRSKQPLDASSPPGDHPAGDAHLLDPHVMEQIGHLELLSRTVVDGLLAGKHRSTTKGGCCEFAQHRQYASGDEIRQIDWQVYARNDRYFIRQYEEETNLHGILALDTSGSMRFGLSTATKMDHARKAAACLARLLLRQRDAVGAVILNENAPLFLPPRQNAAHLQAVFSTLQNARAGGDVDVAASIRASVPRFRRRGMFILFSDCFGDLDALATSLRIVRARGHDVVVMHVLAPEEVRFDFRRWSSFQSLESANQRLHLDPAAVRDEYLNRFGKFLHQLEELVVGLGGDYVRLVTDENLADAIGWFLRSRMARAR